MSKLEQLLVDEKKKVLIIDGHNLIFRCVFIANKEDPFDEEFSLWKHLIVSNLNLSITKFKPDEVILAQDSLKSWRKQVYSNYKAQRKGQRVESKINFEKFFPVVDTFFADLKETFSCIKFLKVDTAEGDDVVAVLTKDILNNCKIVNVSNDKDMTQLLKYKYYSQYDPIQRKLLVQMNPKKFLLLKILTGDKSDNIPAIKKRCGISTATKMIENGLDNYLINAEMKNNFNRNRKLIDFEMIPDHLKKEIRREYESLKIEKINGQKLFNFFVKHRLKYFLNNHEKLLNNLKKLL